MAVGGTAGTRTYGGQLEAMIFPICKGGTRCRENDWLRGTAHKLDIHDVYEVLLMMLCSALSIFYGVVEAKERASIIVASTFCMRSAR